MTDTFSQIFGKQSVKELTAEDFMLDYDPPIRLRFNDCMLILFHNGNSESQIWARLWAAIGAQIPTPVFARLDLIREKKVAAAFTAIRSKPGPFSRFGLEGYPVVLAYQGGVPVGFYNGDRDMQAMANYAVTTACRPGYLEPIQIVKGVHIDQSYEMGGYTESPRLVDSLQFVAGKSIRDYNPATGIRATPTQAAPAQGPAAPVQTAAATVPTIGGTAAPTTLGPATVPVLTGAPATVAISPATAPVATTASVLGIPAT